MSDVRWFKYPWCSKDFSCWEWQEIIWWCMMVAPCVAQSWMGRPASTIVHRRHGGIAWDLGTNSFDQKKQIYFGVTSAKQSLCVIKQKVTPKMTSSYPQGGPVLGKRWRISCGSIHHPPGFGQQPRLCTASGARWCLSAGRCAASLGQGGQQHKRCELDS